MITLKILIFIIVGFSFLQAKSYADLFKETKKLNAKVEDASGKTVYILNSEANIEITSNPGSTLTADAKIELGDMGEENQINFFEATTFKIEPYKKGYRIILETPEQSWFEQHKSIFKRLFSVVTSEGAMAKSITLKVSVPEKQSVVIENKYGDVSVVDLLGELSITNESGNVNLAGIGGKTEVNNRYANINITDLNGDLTIRSSSSVMDIKEITGNVDIVGEYKPLAFLNIAGDFKFSGTSCEIKGKGVGGDCVISNAYKSIEIKNVAGKIDLRGTSMRMNITNVGGDGFVEGSYKPIYIDSLKGNIVLNGNSSDTELNNITGKVDLKNYYKPISLKNTGGTININSQSCEIKIENGKSTKITSSYKPAIIKNIKGDVSIDGNSTEINLDDISGDVFINDFYKPIKGKNIGGKVNITGSSCSIILDKVQSDIDIESEYKPVILSGTEGSIKVKGNSCRVDITHIRKIPENAVIDISTIYKPVRLELPKNSNVQIAAHSEYGKIKSDFPVFLMDDGIPYFKDSNGARITIETSKDIDIIEIN